MRNYLIVIVFASILYVSCSSKKTSEGNVADAKIPTGEPITKMEKFEPEDGKVLLFAGQNLKSIGGLGEYNDGYMDHFDKPAGFTMYTNIRPGDESFGYIYKGLDGITTTDDWGDSPYNMQMQVDNPNFDNMMLGIGLELVNHEDSVAMGYHDDYIVRLGNWLKGLGNRPVFLRIGYEFDGHEWNHYDNKQYIAAFKRVRNMFDSMEVNNVAYVWQSKGFGTSVEEFNDWYPGDDYVDWCAYSFFAYYRAAKPMIDFAREHNKPVFIFESTPMVYSEQDSTKNMPIDLAIDDQAQLAWDKWFTPLFTTINEHPDVIKGLSYINCEWKANPMWMKGTPFEQIDARLNRSKMISKKWKEITSSDKFIKSSPSLYQMIN